ncbi:hypothetical protein [Chryseobacterium populi]|uniref:hypothetical protein n=1 Tax=Chryseobacterium populi TaxID=1144316 RepID=UPI0012E00243|nr:hypothetical protein [Chryseobacterium populi]
MTAIRLLTARYLNIKISDTWISVKEIYILRSRKPLHYLSLPPYHIIHFSMNNKKNEDLIFFIKIQGKSKTIGFPVKHFSRYEKLMIRTTLEEVIKK